MSETYDTLKFERDGAGAVITLHEHPRGAAAIGRQAVLCGR
jgi:hypothetical protein